jgi:hypothetical protein
MKWILQVMSFIGLGLTVVPSFFVFAGTMTWDTHALLMLVGTILWFATSPFWMEHHKPGEAP